MTARITRRLTLQALTMALGQQHQAAGPVPWLGSGSQYPSTNYQDKLKGHGIVCGMRQHSDCSDDAVTEGFLAALKVELGHDDLTWLTRGHAGRVLGWIKGF